ncbi:MAG: hypothetical protein AB7O59_20855 [Pirellulales bacterium]
MPDEPSTPLSQRRLIAVIMAALAVWALYVAIGAYLYNFDPMRAVVVLVCMAAFLGFWLLLLRRQRGGKRL